MKPTPAMMKHLESILDDDFNVQIHKQMAKKLIDLGYIVEEKYSEQWSIGVFHSCFHKITDLGRKVYFENIKEKK